MVMTGWVIGGRQTQSGWLGVVETDALRPNGRRDVRGHVVIHEQGYRTALPGHRGQVFFGGRPIVDEPPCPQIGDQVRFLIEDTAGPDGWRSSVWTDEKEWWQAEVALTARKQVELLTAVAATIAWFSPLSSRTENIAPPAPPAPARRELPRTIETAERAGWTVRRDDGRQVILDPPPELREQGVGPITRYHPRPSGARRRPHLALVG